MANTIVRKESKPDLLSFKKYQGLPARTDSRFFPAMEIALTGIPRTEEQSQWNEGFNTL